MANQKDTSAVDTVYSYLFQNIRNGTWKPGDKIPSEADLCGISIAVNFPEVKNKNAFCPNTGKNKCVTCNTTR